MSEKQTRKGTKRAVLPITDLPLTKPTYPTPSPPTPIVGRPSKNINPRLRKMPPKKLVVQKIPSEMEEAPRYKMLTLLTLMTLLTLLTLMTLMTLLTLLTLLHC